MNTKEDVLTWFVLGGNTCWEIQDVPGHACARGETAMGLADVILHRLPAGRYTVLGSFGPGKELILDVPRLPLQALIGQLPNGEWTWELHGDNCFKARCVPTDDDTQSHIVALMIDALGAFPGLEHVGFRGCGKMRFKTVLVAFDRSEGWLERFKEWVALQEWPQRPVTAARTDAAVATAIEAITPYLPYMVSPANETPAYQEPIDDARRKELQVRARAARDILQAIAGDGQNDVGRLRRAIEVIDHLLGGPTNAYSALGGDLIAGVWQYCTDFLEIAKKHGVQP